MKILGQPESYSDMLERIFWFTFATGVFCTFWLGLSSPAVKSFLDSVSIEADIGFIKGLKALYVLIPLVVAIVSRVIKLHDRISDLLLIRRKFDTKHILTPLAKKVGSNVKPDVITRNRIDMMYKVFYPYAGFKDPSIDSQLVRSALDNWGWLWVEVELCCLFLLTAIIFLLIGKGAQFLVNLGLVVCLIVFSLFNYRACIRSAVAEVNSILNDDQRRKEILQHFSSFERESK